MSKKNKTLHKTDHVISKGTSKIACIFCGSKINNELKLGKMYASGDFKVHYYCMLFASGLKQAGASDSDGILGFLPKDIKAEAKRGSRLKCCYCKKTGATVGCCSRNCRKAFHLACGNDHDSMHQFFGTFCSFCCQHRPIQKVSTTDLTTAVSCPICLTSVDPKLSYTSLQSPCCNNSWFHRVCIQKQALNSGYFFKCPICNDRETFQEEMLQFGIYIPQQDASWEREENAFQELLFRHNHCDAKICNCPRGRDYDKEESKWEVKLCKLCGSQGIHKGCGRLRSMKSNWECTDCKETIKRAKYKDYDHDSDAAFNEKIGKKNLSSKAVIHQQINSKSQGKQYSVAKIKKLSFSSGVDDRCNNASNHGCVKVTLTHDTVIKVSLDDWTSLIQNATELIRKMKEQKNSQIGWMKLKEEYKSGKSRRSVVRNSRDVNFREDHDLTSRKSGTSYSDNIKMDVSENNVSHSDLEISDRFFGDIAKRSDSHQNSSVISSAKSGNSPGELLSNKMDHYSPFARADQQENTPSGTSKSFQSLFNFRNNNRVQKARKSMRSSVSTLDMVYARQVLSA